MTKNFDSLTTELKAKLAATITELARLREDRRQHALAAATGNEKAKKSIAIIDAKVATLRSETSTLEIAIEETERQKAEAEAQAAEQDRQRRIAEAKKIAAELQNASAETDKLMGLVTASLVARDKVIDRLAETGVVFSGTMNALRRSSRLRAAAWRSGLGERLRVEHVAGQQQSLAEADHIRPDLIGCRAPTIVSRTTAASDEVAA